MNCIQCDRILPTKSKEKFCSIQCKMLNNVTFSDECWLWNGSRRRVRFHTKFYSVWKASYKIYRGLESVKIVGTSCKIPNCIRPEHIIVNEIKTTTVEPLPIPNPPYKKLLDAIVKLVKNTYKITIKRGV